VLFHFASLPNDQFAPILFELQADMRQLALAGMTTPKIRSLWPSACWRSRSSSRASEDVDLCSVSILNRFAMRAPFIVGNRHDAVPHGLSAQ
jgi:hypothetical protein